MNAQPVLGRAVHISAVCAVRQHLEVPDSAYEAATERHQAVGRWLCADGSPLSQYNPRIYAQGSFALGTVIRPYERSDYDIDAVVQLDGGPSSWTPLDLKQALGDRLRADGKYEREALHRRPGPWPFCAC